MLSPLIVSGIMISVFFSFLESSCHEAVTAARCFFIVFNFFSTVKQVDDLINTKTPHKVRVDVYVDVVVGVCVCLELQKIASVKSVKTE